MSELYLCYQSLWCDHKRKLVHLQQKRSKPQTWRDKVACIMQIDTVDQGNETAPFSFKERIYWQVLLLSLQTQMMKYLRWKCSFCCVLLPARWSIEKLGTDWLGDCFSPCNFSWKNLVLGRWGRSDECCTWGCFCLCLKNPGQQNCLF